MNGEIRRTFRSELKPPHIQNYTSQPAPVDLSENAADPQTGAARNQESYRKIRRGIAVCLFQIRCKVMAEAKDGRVDCRKN